MKIRKIIMGIILISVITLAVACGTESNTRETFSDSPQETSLKIEQDLEKSSKKEFTTEDIEEQSGEIQTATLETLSELLGKSDSQAAEVFGGGEENWTGDKAIYIGRIYQVKLFDEEVSVYTTYDDKQLVNAISIWLVNGEQKVEEEDTKQWVERLTEFTGEKPVFNDTLSEAGSKNWKWFLGNKAFTLNWMEDILTISMNVMIGELN